jgi:hypothetical protein
MDGTTATEFAKVEKNSGFAVRIIRIDEIAKTLRAEWLEIKSPNRESGG